MLRICFLSLYPAFLRVDIPSRLLPDCPCPKTALNSLFHNNKMTAVVPDSKFCAMLSKGEERFSSGRSQANPGIYLFSLAWMGYYDYFSNQPYRAGDRICWLALSQSQAIFVARKELISKSHAGEGWQGGSPKSFGRRRGKWILGGNQQIMLLHCACV